MSSPPSASPSPSTTSSAPSDTSPNEWNDEELRSLISTAMVDEDLVLDDDLKKKMEGLLEPEGDRDQTMHAVALFLIWCAASEQEASKMNALFLIHLVPFEFGDQQEEVISAMKMLILSSLKVESLREEAFSALVHFVKTWQKDYDIVDNILTMPHEVTVSDECFAEGHPHVCPLYVIGALAYRAPKCAVGRLATITRIYCEALETAPASVQLKYVAMMMMAARRCKSEVRQAFDAVVERSSEASAVLAVALIGAADAAVFTTSELAACIGRCLQSSVAEVRSFAGGVVARIANEKTMGQGERAAAALLLPQLLQMADVDDVVEDLRTLATDAPAFLLANLTAVLVYCTKALNSEDKECDKDELREMLATLCKKAPNLDHSALEQIFACVTSSIVEPSQKDFLDENVVGNSIIFGGKGHSRSVLRRMVEATKSGDAARILMPMALMHLQEDSLAKRLAGIEMLLSCASNRKKTTGGPATKDIVAHILPLLLDQHPMVRDCAIGGLRGIDFEQALQNEEECKNTVICALIAILYADAVPRVGANAASVLDAILEQCPAGARTEYDGALLRAFKQHIDTHRQQLVDQRKTTVINEVFNALVSFMSRLDKATLKGEEEKALAEEMQGLVEEKKGQEEERERKAREERIERRKKMMENHRRTRVTHFVTQLDDEAEEKEVKEEGEEKEADASDALKSEKSTASAD